MQDTTTTGKDCTISLIVAAADDNAIGMHGQLLWHLPRDLSYFKNKTWGMVVIMGRKTFEAVNKPLPGRVNIVITRNAAWKGEGAVVVPTLEEAIEEAKKTNCRELFIIGGGEIYRQGMDITDRIYMTRVHGEFEADTYFPEIDNAQWELVDSIPSPEDEKHAYAMDFETWERIKR
jgi:dihydrofolate reductase